MIRYYICISLFLIGAITSAAMSAWKTASQVENVRLLQPGSVQSVPAGIAAAKPKPTATPSATPPPSVSPQVIQITDYRLLQAIILLGILIVMIIFWGVWRNRDHTIMR